MGNTLLETKQLSKKYGDFTALSPTSLSIEKGCIYGLIGKNGAGKSTLLRLITGQTNPTSGEIILFGKTGSELGLARKRTGAIVEHPAFYPDLSGRNNLEYYRIQKGITEKNSINRVLQEVDLLEIADKKFKNYSLGNKQRLGLALALLGNPDFLILDEPINGLDPMGIIEIRNLLLELNQKKHITILISSHILSELETMITRVGFIDKGCLIEALEMRELHEKCQKYIELTVDDSGKAVAVLEEKLLLKHYEVLPDHIIHVYKDKKVIPEISKALNQHDIAIHSLTEKGLTLEEYFIRLMGGNGHA